MTEYEKFISEYKKVADEILNKETPLEVVKVIEENLTRIHDLSQKLEPYLRSINELPVNVKSNKRWKIKQELDKITIPILELKEKFYRLFDTKGNKYYRDKEIDAIIDLFCLYDNSILDRINTTILYISKNNDFLLTRNKILNDREKQNSSDTNAFLRILIKYKGDKTKLFNRIKDHFPEQNHDLLLSLLNGGDIGSGKLIYHGEAKELITPFKELYHENLIQSRYTTIINWIQENFKYYHYDEPKELNIDTIKKYFRKN